ncbi:deoxyribodipyrimidine photo-lyase [Patescibacteria group bacterium]|nr:deoxyribodipyrimidine photo-lyase [Patescibacteria group bacterium]
MKQQVSIFWFRRDLRLDDNRGLYEALHGDHSVVPIFIFDTSILDTLPNNDHRVTFIYDTIQSLRDDLQNHYHSSIDLRYGTPLEVFEKMTTDYEVAAVYTNQDYEPYARDRDQSIKNFLDTKGILFHTFKDQVIFEKDEVIKDDGDPYVVYTPYMKKWRQLFNKEKDLPNYDIKPLGKNFYQHTRLSQLDLVDMGFERSLISVPAYDVASSLIERYGEKRDYPSLDATSHLGPYLRFGIVSIRRMMEKALTSNDPTFSNELIWREFFMQILWHYPHTADHAFREVYDTIPWVNNEDQFEKWKQGKTGYPIVDAGMRQLNQTGYMHNRVRMVVASFLCKHLLIDWRWGERYFAKKLFDYDLAANVGNWQWAAGSGVDAAPYFRVFNPTTQMEKFDPNGDYIRTWVPEYFGVGYVSEMVDHKEARDRAIETYKIALRSYED